MDMAKESINSSLIEANSHDETYEELYAGVAVCAIGFLLNMVACAKICLGR